MQNLPNISVATAEAIASKMSTLDLEHLESYIEKNSIELAKTNPVLYQFMVKMDEILFCEKSIAIMNKISKTPEDFARRIQIGNYSLMFFLIKLIDSQIEADKMKDLYQ